MCFIKSWHHGKCNAMAVCEEYVRSLQTVIYMTQYNQLQVLVFALH